ncbi:outer membrane protein assembly factor BamA [Lewinella aquimaris]|uniref:Outer membrane protein assembly factor BamA n=1 Tax=Neolewinella aquimaris TaxID=1835722 RepID=A0A840EG96_9BACT|nr:BamA/TamA family outer membrane protein [Neolewinella aquimaris]MBB4079936.1 outer membrane protein assembly factor BamA [Neolewinella aquimaris]
MRLTAIILLLLFPLLAQAGPGDSVLVEEVILLGHRKTRPRVVYREMTFGRGDKLALDDFDHDVGRSYNNLMNSGLFASVDLEYDSTQVRGGGSVTITVRMRETWYIYPVPVFELADRNFNVWWTEEERSLDRVNVGGKLTYYNFTGQRDRLKLGFTTGYTRSLQASYRLPYLNRAGSIGMEIEFSNLRRREQNYLTLDNRQEFYFNPDAFVYRRSNLDLSLSYRKKIYVSHHLSIGWRQSEVADTIGSVLNPEFYGGGRTQQKYFRLAYDFQNDRRDIRNYPWKGKFLSVGIAKEGLGIYGQRDGLEIHGDYRKFVPFGKRYSLNYAIAAKYSLIRTRQPFLENRAIGFGNNGLIGYQFYVVDGLDMLIWRLGVRRELIKTKVDLGKLVFIDAFRYIPLRVLVSLQFNQGIANAPFVDGTNRLNNNLLTGMGAGIDLVLYYDMVAGVQYNRNHLGEDGVYLNLNLSF